MNPISVRNKASPSPTGDRDNSVFAIITFDFCLGEPASAQCPCGQMRTRNIEVRTRPLVHIGQVSEKLEETPVIWISMKALRRCFFIGRRERPTDSNGRNC